MRQDHMKAYPSTRMKGGREDWVTLASSALTHVLRFAGIVIEAPIDTTLLFPYRFLYVLACSFHHGLFPYFY